MKEATPAGSDRLVLMNPGPVMTDHRVREALAGPDLCHREPEFADLMGRVRQRTTRLCAGDARHTSVILTGSGTSAVEAAISSVVPRDGGLLVIDNGHYGERFQHIAVAHGIRTHHLRLGWEAPVDLDEVDRLLGADSTLTHVGVVHHETSTGRLNDVAAISRIAHARGRQVIVDAVSSVGADAISLADDEVDWLAGSSNKCVEGAPGLSFVSGRRAAFEALEDLPRRSFSLDLHRHYVAQEKALAPAFTPGVPAFYAFDIALGLALEEGREARHARYLALAQQLRTGLAELGLEIMLAPEERSVCLTAIRIPEGRTYEWLHHGMRASGFVIYSAQEQLKNRIFRLSTMGCMTSRDIADFLSGLRRLLHPS
ncbi:MULTISPECIES: pyridoxal-phosphate-dependent aminotransferase family protein [unclassified Streptomyces]|uniref:pyridoxal-phosphate-dependent aminotransferase family protein n=1 Tax=unclassified Streptomyces TaxID=2593676 RepID=UPI0037AB39FD